MSVSEVATSGRRRYDFSASPLGDTSSSSAVLFSLRKSFRMRLLVNRANRYKTKSGKTTRSVKNLITRTSTNLQKSGTAKRIVRVIPPWLEDEDVGDSSLDLSAEAGATDRSSSVVDSFLSAAPSLLSSAAAPQTPNGSLFRNASPSLTRPTGGESPVGLRFLLKREAEAVARVFARPKACVCVPRLAANIRQRIAIVCLISDAVLLHGMYPWFFFLVSWFSKTFLGVMYWFHQEMRERFLLQGGAGEDRLCRHGIPVLSLFGVLSKI